MAPYLWIGMFIVILAIMVIIVFEGKKKKRKKVHTKTRLVIVQLSYKSLFIQNSIIMSLTLDANELVKGVLGVVRRDTGAAVANLSFSDITFTSSDTAIFGVTLDPEPNTLDVQTVAVGSAVLSLTTTASYTDPDDETKTRTESKSVSIPVTVTQPATQTDLVVTFGTPIPQSL